MSCEMSALDDLNAPFAFAEIFNEDDALTLGLASIVDGEDVDEDVSGVGEGVGEDVEGVGEEGGGAAFEDLFALFPNVEVVLPGFAEKAPLEGAPLDAKLDAPLEGLKREGVKLPGRKRFKAQDECNRLVAAAMVRERQSVMALRPKFFDKCITVNLVGGALTFVYEQVRYFSLNDANIALNKEYRLSKGLAKSKVTANAWKLKVCPSLKMDLGEYCGREVVPFSARGEKAAAAKQRSKAKRLRVSDLSDDASGLSDLSDAEATDSDSENAPPWFASVAYV
jgi:hypothetical protein